MQTNKIQSDSPQNPKLSLKTHALMVVMACLLFLGNSFDNAQVLKAQGGASVDNSVPLNIFSSYQTDTNYQCEPAMKEFASKQLEDFRKFTETNFQNKSSTASLLDNAIQKYRELRKGLMAAYSQYYPNQGAFILSIAAQPNSCLKIVQDTLGDAQILLKTHAITTSGVKKSSGLLEKYQSINGQLQNLNQQFTSMKALFDTFSQKLPCYVKKGECLK